MSVEIAKRDAMCSNCLNYEDCLEQKVIYHDKPVGKCGFVELDPDFLADYDGS